VDEHRVWRAEGYEVSTDPGRLDVGLVHAVLRESYWAPGIPRDTVERSIAHSLPFGLYAPDGTQAGFARAVTDRATFAWIADVFVVEAHRGRGLGVWLMRCVLDHPDLHGLRRLGLATADAHGLYRRFGFGPPADPAILMLLERAAAEVYGES
jgi:GNAT superfamily N-acetyltransferase